MFSNFKKIYLTDIIGIFKFIIILIPSLIYKVYLKIKNKELWLVCEKENMARDNGYIFYKYLKDSHPELLSYYAIDKKCSDYDKIKKLKNIVQWRSLKHYFIYMSATRNISSHKEGNPNHPLFTILHRKLNMYNNRVFLQHGVLYEDFKMFHWKNTKFDIFICGAQKEYEFVKENYGYPNNVVKYTGLARFDNLYDFKVNKQYILFIPTWRRWLDSEKKFVLSEYYQRLNSLINSEKLKQLLEEKNKYLLFYPHISIQKYIRNFNTSNNRVKICDMNNSNIQDLIKEGAMLITDYSSLFTDFAFMEKPIIYYQFDRDEFYTKHLQGYPYLDFKKDGFGKIVNNEEELISSIKYYIDNDYNMEKKYIENIDEFFGIRDNKNCERIYNTLIEGMK